MIMLSLSYELNALNTVIFKSVNRCFKHRWRAKFKHSGNYQLRLDCHRRKGRIRNIFVRTCPVPDDRDADLLVDSLDLQLVVEPPLQGEENFAAIRFLRRVRNVVSLFKRNR